MKIVKEPFIMPRGFPKSRKPKREPFNWTFTVCCLVFGFVAVLIFEAMGW